MQSPREAPVDVAWLKKSLPRSLTVNEIKGWHLYSLGFAMQIMSLKKSLHGIYTWLARLFYRTDEILLNWLNWESFSQPGRFILCSIKLEKK
jgi:hypothetical protein